MVAVHISADTLWCRVILAARLRQGATVNIPGESSRSRASVTTQVEPRVTAHVTQTQDPLPGRCGPLVDPDHDM